MQPNPQQQPRTWQLDASWRVESVDAGKGFLLHDSVTDQRVRLSQRATDLALLFRVPQGVETALADAARRWPDQPSADGRALVAKLQANGLLSPIHEANERTAEASVSAKVRQQGRQWLNPFSIRLDMADPSVWLSDHNRLVGFVFGRFGAVALGLALVLLPFLLLFNASDLSRYLLTEVSPTQVFVATIAVWPFLKLAHECAHAGTLHHFGGTVKRCGITLLFFLPLPFVDASDAWRLPSRRQRILVTLAGVLSEWFIACICLLLYTIASDGVIKTALAATVMVACVSSVLINANPLMKFDGYHVLQDLLGTSNLQAQSAETVKRILWRGLGAAHRATVLPQRWKTYLIYGVSSLLFRLFVLLSLCLWFVQDIPLIGPALAGLLMLTACVIPLGNLVRSTLKNRAELFATPTRRWRATAVLSMIVLAFAVLPLPRYVTVDGVVSFHDARVVAPRAGGELHWRIRDGDRVKAGDEIAALRSPALEHAVSLQMAVVQRLAEERRSANTSANPADRKERVLHESRLRAAEIELADRQRKLDALTIRAEHDGVVHVEPQLTDDGSWVDVGRTIATLVPGGDLGVTVLVDQRLAAQLESGALAITAASRDTRRVQASAAMVSLSPLDRIPGNQTALTQHGGGDVAVDQDMKPLLGGGAVFSSRLVLDDPDILIGLHGQRVAVRYQLSALPAMTRLTQTLRDTFFHIHS